MKPADGPLLPAGVVGAAVTSRRGDAVSHDPDFVAVEVPVALVFNGVSHAVMLASPADLEDFALGFALTEGIVERASQCYGIEVVERGDAVEVAVDIAAACAMRLKERRRTLAGRTGCGLCGVESLDQVKRTLPRAPAVRVGADAVARAQRSLRGHQAMQQLTGATHAAAWCALDGAVLAAREDVGRHNALDKLAGALARGPFDGAAGFVCVTSRASFEMVQKTAMLGAGALAAVSAPTALAIDTARGCSLALAGFVRGDDLVAYTFPERFGLA